MTAVRKMNGVLNLADVHTKPMSFSEMLDKFAVCICIATLAFRVRSRGCRHFVTPVVFCSAFSFACPYHSVHQASR